MKKLILICLSAFALSACTNTPSNKDGNGGGGGTVPGGHAAKTNAEFQQMVAGAWESTCQTENGMEFREVLWLNGQDQGATVKVIYTQPACKGQGQQQQQENFNYKVVSTDAGGSKVQLTLADGRAGEAMVLVNGDKMSVNNTSYTKLNQGPQ
jgi:hypothetical protein